MQKIYKSLLILGIFFVSSCGLTDLEGNLNDPNNVSVDQLDLNLLHNKIQAEFANFQRECNETGMELTRMLSMIGGDNYQRAYQAQDNDDIWSAAYVDVLEQIETLVPKATALGAYTHAGTAKILKAYTYITLVDMFGDVPYLEANKGTTGNFNPVATTGKDIYANSIALLDEAIVDLGKTSLVGLSRDVYYGGSAAKWIALANTLKLKAYMNLRLTDNANAKSKIEALLKADIIDTEAEEFTYKYGTADIPTRSRTELYRQFYQTAAGNANGYIGNYFLWEAYKSKGVEDPRWRYYFFRQVGSKKKALADDEKSVPCAISPKPDHYITTNQVFCFVEPGFYGRDHGNNDGIPPDGKAITAVGVYPYGGAVDVNPVDSVNYQKSTLIGQGANGAGIEPIWMHFYTDFLKAEAYLTLGIAGDAKAAMLNGINGSIARVQKFGTAKGQVPPASLVASTSAYTTAIGTLYDGSADQLGVAMKEYYVALWGNGVEAYNLYRRTGKPANIQPMRAVNGGKFIRSLVYPSDYANLNANAKQKTFDAFNKVFWDNNPDNFVY